MGVAVELYFNETGEARVRDLMRSLTEQGIPPILAQLGFRPHISLAVFSNLSPAPVVSLVEKFAPSLDPFWLDLSYIGVFPSNEGVTFLAPVFTGQLSTLHRALHAELQTAGLESDSYYLPDRWVPHCTVTTDITPVQQAKAVQVLGEAFRPFRVQCVSIGVITFRPVVTYACFALGAG